MKKLLILPALLLTLGLSACTTGHSGDSTIIIPPTPGEGDGGEGQSGEGSEGQGSEGEGGQGSGGQSSEGEGGQGSGDSGEGSGGDSGEGQQGEQGSGSGGEGEGEGGTTPATTYTVTFNSNGGSAVDPQTVESGNKVTKPSNPTKAGYSFEGWFTDSACTQAFDFTTSISGDITLYAKWKEIPAGGYGYDYYDGYYGELTWTDGEDLKEKLHDIISKDVNYLRYTSPNWETNQFADQSIYDYEMVNAVYNNDDIAKTNTQKGWQREHAFVASLMTGVPTGNAVETHQGRAVDWHNLFAGDSSGNQSRSDKNFGYADKKATGYTNTGSYSYDTKTFEPSDEDKGMLARAIFYMGVMYSTEEEETVKFTLNYNDADKATYGKASTTVHVPVTYKPVTIQEEAVGSINLVSYTKYHYHEDEATQVLVEQYGEDEDGYGKYVAANCKYAIGHLSDLLKWSELPVNLQEYQHNESVYSHVNSLYGLAQNNRNPFVDYPGLVDYIYGDKQDQAGDLSDLEPSYHYLEMHIDEISHYAIKEATRAFEVGETFDKESYQLVAVKKDLSETSLPQNADSTQPYTFVESDIGSKVMIIDTDKNDIKLKVSVEEASLDYSYIYEYAGDRTDFGTSDYEAGVAKPLTLAGKGWNATAAHVANISNRNSPLGVSIGNGTSKCAEKFTLVSQSEFNNVNAFKFIVNTAAGKTMTLTVKIGDETVKTISITGNSSANITELFELTAAKSGIVTIEFSGLVGSLYINTIAINEVK